MYTRKDYMQRKCSHREYYAQFVDASVIHLVKTRIGKERIIASEDAHLNDIPLKEWDMLHDHIRHICGKKIATANGTGGISLSDTVCVAKEAAKQIKDTGPASNKH